jgi:hypothetical protein
MRKIFQFNKIDCGVICAARIETTLGIGVVTQ